MTASATDTLRTRRARNAVLASFLVSGVSFSTWVSRLPDAADRLDLDDRALGLLLLCASTGALLSMSTSGRTIQLFGPRRVVQAGTLLNAFGAALMASGIGVLGSTPLTGIGLFFFGAGFGVWDVAMNVEGAEVERRLGRTIMPRFHAAYSLGTVGGALVGAGLVKLGLPVLPHLLVGIALVVGVSLGTVGGFLTGPVDVGAESGGGMRARDAWREPRTLLIGVMVLGLAMTEGTANDWLALALERGHDAERWMAVAGFATFVTAMTVGRIVGPVLLDRHDRAVSLWASIAMAVVGVVVVVVATAPWLVFVGIVVWGLGSSLGFPVGMSAAADDPARAAARVSVVSLIGYLAFLVGPPLIGFVGHEVGTLDALLTLLLVLVPAALCVPAARRLRPGR
ncbi:MFS transporter [Nocardioides marmoribigeumensis]|uniref:MFS family permease n=1 Tax=Nocardioides marmoribigeumensis TaxID=433649 RepID=A0ABU2BSW1_9ACTN|nr:MFS transporter [Nocardioides marmoribigeumensis]MDR7360823.1 MFS family permease [Nocardioides marmoribigeumensis]